MSIFPAKNVVLCELIRISQLRVQWQAFYTSTTMQSPMNGSCSAVVVGHMFIGSSDCGIRWYQKHSCISSHKKTQLSVCEVFLQCSKYTHTVKTTIQIKTFILFVGFKCRQWPGKGSVLLSDTWHVAFCLSTLDPFASLVSPVMLVSENHVHIYVIMSRGIQRADVKAEEREHPPVDRQIRKHSEMIEECINAVVMDKDLRSRT